MKTICAVFRNRRPLGLLRLIFLLMALALVGIDQAPRAVAARSGVSLGGDLVAFEDPSYTNPNQMSVDREHAGRSLDRRVDVTARAIRLALLPNDGVPGEADGGVLIKQGVVGQPCDRACAEIILTGAASEDRHPDTNGEVVVYSSNRAGETDIYYQPVGGGTETRIAIPGKKRDVRISGNLIVFESQTAYGYDVFVYDISTRNLYQVTNTPGVDESLSDISVCNGIGRIVYAVAGGWGDFDTYAFMFQLPSSVPGQINDLIALVRSFHLPYGIENSLLTKLQDAIAALGASDTATACDSLRAFTNQCSAQSGKALTVEQASQLIDAASRISTGLACQ